jgi:hypothetical protein
MSFMTPAFGVVFKVDKDKSPVLYAAENKKIMNIQTIDRIGGLDETIYRIFDTKNPFHPVWIDRHLSFYGRLQHSRWTRLSSAIPPVAGNLATHGNR